MLPTADDRAEIETLRSYLERNPEDSATLTRLAALLFINPPFDEEEAEALFHKAIALDPKSTEARFWLAQMLVVHCAQPRQAIGVLKEALAIDPRRTDCLSLLACALIDMGEPPGAYISFLERAVGESPDWVTPRHALAVALLDLGRFDEARNMLEPTLDEFRLIPTPTDSLERYYESAVTGRTSSNEFGRDLVYLSAGFAKWKSMPRRALKKILKRGIS